MLHLIDHPIWQADDLGKPIPDSPHAVSVCLPTWRDNIGYEELDPRVHDKMTTGYPRFVFNQFCQQLFDEAERQFAQPEERCLVFPNQSAAQRCAKSLNHSTGSKPSVNNLNSNNAHAVCFGAEFFDLAKQYWQHTGEGISSRQAEACLAGNTGSDGKDAIAKLKQNLASLYAVSSADVFLFSCGMSSLLTLHRAFNELLPGRKSVQFGFPYVDTLKLQEKFGSGVHFLTRGNQADIDQLAELLKAESINGIYTEFPSNPLLLSPDLSKLKTLAVQNDFPIIVDDTIATVVNANLLGSADVICTSLTKFFSGIGDVTGGCLILNPASRFHASLKQSLQSDADLLWGEDAIVLEHNSKGFSERVLQINSKAEALANFLQQHPAIETVYYPKYQQRELYDKFRTSNGGYGGLMSILVKDPENRAAEVYDRLRVCKGPNLGMNYTLACPFTILAHYQELDFAESCGVSRWLIRLSVGMEESDDLIGRFEEALR
jgi:cystathionine gamma-synthase